MGSNSAAPPSASYSTRRPSARVVRLRQLFVEGGPVHLPPHFYQRMARINQPLQLDSEQFPLRLVNGGFWLHRFPRFLLVWLDLAEKGISFKT